MKTVRILILLAGFPLISRGETTVVVHASTPQTAWSGWGYSGPAAPASAPAIPQAPAKFKLVENSRTFSGTVTGLKSPEGVEIGIVSLVGVHWVNPKCYQWQPVNADGTFSITSNAFPEAGKALVVRGPEIPWTFLAQDFAPNQGARDVVIPVPAARKVRISVGSSEQDQRTSANFEFFPANREFGNDGKPLRRQRLDQVRLKDQSSAEVWLPRAPVAVLVGSKGLASAYQVIDPREGDHFHFVLQAGGTLKVTTQDAEGNPVPNVRIDWINPAAPLSLSNGRTNEAGVLERDSLTPGPFALRAEGFAPGKATVESGRTTEVVLQALPKQP